MFAPVEMLWQELRCRQKWKMSNSSAYVCVCVCLRAFVRVSAQRDGFLYFFFIKEAPLQISNMSLQDRRPPAGAQRGLAVGCLSA